MTEEEHKLRYVLKLMCEAANYENFCSKVQCVDCPMNDTSNIKEIDGVSDE